MSEYYNITLNFATRCDMPAPVVAVLTALANGTVPAKADLATLPMLIAHYLGHPSNAGPVNEGGAAWRFTPIGWPRPDEKPGDATHLLHMERVFQDDELANAGIHFVHWLFQFALDGHLGVELPPDAAPPTLYVRQGDDLVTTYLGFAPDTSGAATATPKTLIVVEQTLRQPLAKAIQAAIDWNPEAMFD